MTLTSIDHLVLVALDLDRTIAFYRDLLGMDAREERPGKWSLHFGAHKISLQDAASVPEIARGTVPGSGNFCILSDEPVAELAERLGRAGVEILAGPDRRDGASGPIQSIYFHDPDRNLIEIANPLGLTSGERSKES